MEHTLPQALSGGFNPSTPFKSSRELVIQAEDAAIVARFERAIQSSLALLERIKKDR